MVAQANGEIQVVLRPESGEPYHLVSVYLRLAHRFQMGQVLIGEALSL
jgi:hypothetical protein